MPIPLLSFPSDLLRDIFKGCDPFDLYQLSECSKRTRKSIMTNTSKNNWKIKGNDKKIGVLCGNVRYRFIKTTTPTSYYEYSQVNRFYGDWSERVKGMFIPYPNGGFTELFVYLVDTFRIRTVNELRSPNETAPSCSFDQYLELMRSVIDRELDVERLCCDTKGDKCAIANFMELSNQINVTEAFHCDQPNSNLNNQNIDLLLRKWKTNEALRNVQYLDISTKTVDNQSPILGMIPPIEQNGYPKREIYINVNSPSNVREKIIPPPIPESDSEEDSEHEEVPVDVN